MYDDLNEKYFNYKLPLDVELYYNPKIMRCGGRCFIGRDLKIEISKKYIDRFGILEIKPILLHEMIHLMYPNHKKEFMEEVKRLKNFGEDVPLRVNGYCNWVYRCEDCGSRIIRMIRMPLWGFEKVCCKLCGGDVIEEDVRNVV
jgi:predicted SprT family Zn-dependent metalloprotease